MSVVFSMLGVQDLVEVFDDKVTIMPKGIIGFLNKGLKGTKTIPFSSISAVQFKEAGILVNGYLQFTIPGGNESRGGVFSAIKDENTFMFRKKENALAIQIKEYIEMKTRELHGVQKGVPSAGSLSDEIQKLADLRDRGILSEQEFQAAKTCLIG